MKLNRALIKSQAKAIIKGQVFQLFLISAIISVLVGGITTIFSVPSVVEVIKDNTNQANDYGYFDDFVEDGKPNLDYFNDFTGSMGVVASNRIIQVAESASSKLSSIVTIIFAPLSITLCGLYVMIIRGNKFKLEDMFKHVFSKTFDSNYFNKFLLYIIKNVLLVLLLCLFIVPGVIFYYKYYFAEIIMADNPELGVSEAMKRSKQITEGHKGELFALDLSFIGWALLYPLTFGLVSIYVVPYINTTKALYYENFRLRFIQETATSWANVDSNQPQNDENTVTFEEYTYGSGMDTDYYNGNF